VTEEDGLGLAEGDGDLEGCGLRLSRSSPESVAGPVFMRSDEDGASRWPFGP
jgi:hypothetical protein